MSIRESEFPVHDLFIKRWSPRAMSGEVVEYERLMSLFEAAKWAPSSFNNQPWRFVYAQRQTAHWDVFFSLINTFNQTWADKASVLVIVLSLKTFEVNGKPSKTHSYDVGAACQNFALQGSLDGLVIHAIEGFDYDQARLALLVPDDYAIEIMFAVGKPGPVQDLPESLQKKEFLSGRKPLNEVVFEGIFPPR